MRRLWNYIKTWFGVKSKQAMDPEIEIEAAINEARSRDQTLRNQAAKVIANRTRMASEVEDVAEDVAEAKELAKQALLKADAAKQAGKAEDAEKWESAAQGVAMRLQASQRNLDSLQNQLTVADEQAEAAKQAVHDNAMQLQNIASKRMEMLGQLEQAKMQESVNEAMAAIDATVGGDAPSLTEIEDKIQNRMAEAQAKTELKTESPDGIMRELQREVGKAESISVLDDLRAELGIGTGTPAGTSSGSSTQAVSAPPAPTPLPPSSAPSG